MYTQWSVIISAENYMKHSCKTESPEKDKLNISHLIIEPSIYIYTNSLFPRPIDYYKVRQTIIQKLIFQLSRMSLFYYNFKI